MIKGQDAILITGATGQQGGATARALLAAGHKVVAMTRNPSSPKAEELAVLGADFVQADLDDEASLRSVLEGKWGVYAVQNTWEAGVEGEEEQGKRLARLAKEAGVQHFVYASVGSANQATGIPHFDNKYRIKETVRELGLPSYVILRPAFFMENWTLPFFKPGVDDGAVAIAVLPDTQIQMVAVEDIGEYGKMAFEQHQELNGQAIDFAGDEMTPLQLATTLSEVTGREIKHFQVPIEQVREFSDDFAIMLEWFDAVGYSVDIQGNKERYGIPATGFEDWASSVTW
ncbi:MAG TPA: NmrA/HSCARG family protein [Gemmatimonadetes bacterium]|nr:NmrA/HSCARG family protein [Gemmatimonadota bacterium]